MTKLTAGGSWVTVGAALVLSSLLFLYYSKVAPITQTVDQEKYMKMATDIQGPSRAWISDRPSNNDIISEQRVAGDIPQSSSRLDIVTHANEQQITKEEYDGKHDFRLYESVLTNNRASFSVDLHVGPTPLWTPQNDSISKGRNVSTAPESFLEKKIQASDGKDVTSNFPLDGNNSKENGGRMIDESFQLGTISHEKNKLRFTSVLNSSIPADLLNFTSLSDRRLSYMQDRCQDLKVPKRGSRKTIRKKIAVYHLFSTCVAPKGGSTSWYELREKLKKRQLKGHIQAAILSVRHPLSRLTSAYRDKFLNGGPISAYDAAWKNATRSSQTWRYRWSAYWLPALISRGDVKPTLWMTRRRHAKIANVSDVCRSTLISNMAVAHQIERDYRVNMEKYIGLFSNVTFSFRDFLLHVLWTFDHSIMDHHWAPQSCLCDPCGQHYDYLLHLENIRQEVRHVLDDMGVPQDVQIGSDHNTKKALRVSENGYFDAIEKDIMNRLYLLYKNDFDLFAYIH